MVAVDRRDPAPAAGADARVVAAVLACIARHGVAKTTLDDVAREAGCARATLYRRFGSRRGLLEATVAAEADRLLAELEREVARAESIEDALVALMTAAARELRGHEALGFVAAHECELLYPHLVFAGGDRSLAAVAGALTPLLVPFVSGEAAGRLAEWIARLELNLLLSPDAPVDLDDASATRAYVRAFVLPALQPSAASRG